MPMTKKKLAIVSFHAYSVAIYKQIVHGLFGDALTIEEIYFDGGKPAEIDVDLILISSFTIYEEVLERVVNDAEIIVADYTITKKALTALKALPDDTKAALVNLNYKVCIETIILIHQLGIKHLELMPVYPGSAPLSNVTLAITPGESRLIPPEFTTHIDIGHRVLDLNTVIAIANALSLESILQSDAFVSYAMSLASAGYGAEAILGKNQTLNRQLDMLLKLMDRAIVIVTADHVMHAYNQRARSIFDLPKSGGVGACAQPFLENVPYASVLDGAPEVREAIVAIGGAHVVVSVLPIVEFGQVYGVIVLADELTEIEKKQHALRVKLLGKGHVARYTFDAIIGDSPAIQRAVKTASRMAQSTSSVLITGESGTGKEVFAQAIHNASVRRAFQFVAVNCAALSENLLESELFGYADGAFTGAQRGGKQGLFELAHKGTLFLDEIGEITPLLQKKLLRVLQERNFMRIGGDAVIDVDVRIIAATNQDLRALVTDKVFREDLYYRLNVLPLELPPLRSRREDIVPLVDYYKASFDDTVVFSEAIYATFCGHLWPGNVRELMNYVEYLCNIGESHVDVWHLPKHLLQREAPTVSTFKPADLKALGGHYAAEEYTFVLTALYRAHRDRRKIGRKHLCQEAAMHNLNLSEQEIRSILKRLADNGYAHISKGRAGTKITAKGLAFFGDGSFVP